MFPRHPVFRLIALWLLAALLAGCTNLFFHPLEREHWRTPAQYGLPYEDAHFDAGDGTLLHGWFLPAFGEAGSTIIYLHGNTEDIGTHLPHVAWMPAAGLEVFLFDYRGYGASSGTPSFEGILDDIESAIGYVVRRKQGAGQIVVFGQSLGGGMAVRAVANSAYREQIDALVIESAIASYRLIARDSLRSSLLRPLAAPLTRAVPDGFSALGAVGEVSPIPLLVIHSEQDKVVPLHHALRLFEAALAPKELWILPDGDHVRLFDDVEYRIQWLWQVRRLLEAAPRGGLEP